MMAEQNLETYLEKCNLELQKLFREMDQYISALPTVVANYYESDTSKGWRVYELECMQDTSGRFHPFIEVKIKPRKNELYIMFKKGVNDRKGITEPGTPWEPTYPCHCSLKTHSELQDALELIKREYDRFMCEKKINP